MNQDLINRIKDANNIVDVIGEKLSIKKAGVNYIAVCPFHSDRTPSLTISPAKQIYKCFACGAGGDVIKFIQEYDSVSFYEAVKYLANRANIDMPNDIEETGEEKQRRLEREALINKAREEQQNYINARIKREFWDYLAHRNITQETAEAYGLGYCADGFFYNRITYPFYDISGNIIGFTGRAVKWSKESNYPKYKNSAESAIFNKSRAIFGLAQAKRDIILNNNVYWCEGQNDVMSLFQREVKNVVCGSGTAFTEYYAKIISRFTSKVTLIYDGDDAGRNAAIKAIHILLKAGLKVSIITMPEGEDPDSWAQNNYSSGEALSLSAKLTNLSVKWYDYLFDIYPYDKKNIDQNTENLNSLFSYSEDLKDSLTRSQYLQQLCEKFHIGADALKTKVKPIPQTDAWKDGYYGLDEALETYSLYDCDKFELSFNDDYFITNTGNIPVILWKGKPVKHAIQTLRSRIKTFVVDERDISDSSMEVLYEFQKEKINIFVATASDGEVTFTDFYIYDLSQRLFKHNTSEKSILISKALELIAYTDDTMRTMKSTEWSRLLGLKETQYNKLLKPIVEKIQDKATFDKQKYMYQDAEEITLDKLPDYVLKDRDMMRTYNAENYFPMLRKDGKKCAYVFRQDKGEGHSVVSDFYMEPLLHIYSADKQNNKRVLQLFHRNPKIPDKYVEWLSSTLTTLNNIEDQLINEGPYNFKGTAYQYKSLRSQLLYGFTLCEDIESYGQHKGGFWAFSNAIYHAVKKEDGSFENRIDYTNNLGVVSHDNKNYYSPACSEIFIENTNSQYEQDRYFIYKEIPEQDRISFAEWADLMNEVYKINDNGKWAIIFDIMSCFRDYIYDTRRCFTTLFFIGPTGSGKSQIAYSMRSLFMSPDAPVFNLNSGTDAAFWLILARYRNVIAIMEEYNDTTISPIKFQGLKSAVLDGEGRMKVGNMNAKQIDSSKINAIPLLLGQEAPQQDDGSLANRSIICDVPVKANGTFTEHEIEIFEELKQHEKIGLSNVLIEILNIRPIVISNFNNYFANEIKLLKNALSNVQNNDGLTRILNSVAMTTTMCRIIEDKTSLRLPFTYEEFFQLAVAKVMKQVESISTVNKLATYFNTISHLLTQGEIKKGREFKIDTPKDNRVSVRKDGSSYETRVLEPGQRVLYINFSAIYPLYERTTGKDALSQMSLKNYFMANAAYIGFCKSTRFVYIEDTIEETTDGDSGTSIKRQYKSLTNNTCAYLFDYDKIAELMNIDLVREDNTEEENEDGSIHPTEKNTPF